MSRCKCCNSVLEDEELYATQPNGEPEDLCCQCRGLPRTNQEQQIEAPWEDEVDWEDFEDY